MIPISTDTQKIAEPPQGQWTLDDWERLPMDGNRYEVIDAEETAMFACLPGIRLVVGELFAGSPDETL